MTLTVYVLLYGIVVHKHLNLILTEILFSHQVRLDDHCQCHLAFSTEAKVKLKVKAELLIAKMREIS